MTQTDISECVAGIETDIHYLVAQLQRAARFTVGHAADCVRRALDAAERIEANVSDLV